MDRVALARGIALGDLAWFLEPSFNNLADPATLAGASAVATRLVSAVREGRPLAVYGDYDADGMCAAAILHHAIRAARPDTCVHTHVPLRSTEGYGLSVASLEQLAARGIRTIITVDCGVTAFDEAQRAHDLGIELLITDHHALDPRGRLPVAAAIAHPGLGDNPTQLCGAAVAWLVSWAFLREYTGNPKLTTPMRETLLETLALAAVATIADIVPMVGQSRVIARLGLSRVAASGLPGLRALARKAGISAKESVDAERISFGIGPLLNACGRLGKAVDAVELLALPATHERGHDTQSIERRAGQTASEFSQLNQRRKVIEREIVESAGGRLTEGLGTTRGACVLADPGWPRSVVGIACARIAETNRVPTVLLEQAGEMAYGSGRSVEGYSLLNGLQECSHLLERFGGHAAAAGLSLKVANIEAFREALSEHASRHTVGIAGGEIRPDVELFARDISLEAFESLQRLGPFGNGFPQPMGLVRRAMVTSDGRSFGAQGDHLSFHIGLDGAPQSEIRCTWWRQGSRASRIRRGQRVHVVVRPQVDRFGRQPRPAFAVVDAVEAPSP